MRGFDDIPTLPAKFLGLGLGDKFFFLWEI